jgi:SAM-dependent methyltransferase
MHEIPYQGNELNIFQHATVWKNYYGSLIGPYLEGKVLEVGAGMGTTTRHLCSGKQEKWICLEPDPQLYAELERKVKANELPSCCIPFKGIIQDLPKEEKFNTIIYIDVIEHIEKDAVELEHAARLLKNGGHLIVLVPAHQFLYSPFDRAVVHYRRYNKKMLKAVAPEGVTLRMMKYLDSIGLLASLVNKLVLKQKYPSMKQVRFWDKVIVRCSRVIDRLTVYRLGKSLLGIWEKRD